MSSEDPDCHSFKLSFAKTLRTDSIAFEELIEKRNVEIHLVKEGRVIAKDSRRSRFRRLRSQSGLTSAAGP